MENVSDPFSSFDINFYFQLQLRSGETQWGLHTIAVTTAGLTKTQELNWWLLQLKQIHPKPFLLCNCFQYSSEDFVAH